MQLPPLCLLSFFSRCTPPLNSERGNLAKLAPQLTVKACFPSSNDRQDVSLVLKVINELTLSGLQIQNEARCQEYRNNTSWSTKEKERVLNENMSPWMG